MPMVKDLRIIKWFLINKIEEAKEEVIPIVTNFLTEKVVKSTWTTWTLTVHGG